MRGQILIVEDEAVLCKHLARLLTREGYDVATAATCAAALALLAERSFSAVLLDVRLPDGDGLDLLAGLTDEQRPPRALVMTAFTTTENEARAQRLRVDRLLRKPLDLGQLICALRGEAGSRQP